MATKSPTPLQKPTKSFFLEAKKVPNYSWFDKIHGYVYGRWPYLYLGIALGEHPLAKRMGPILGVFSRLFPPKDQDDPNRKTSADTYHGKVVSTEAAAQLVSVTEDITLPDLEKVIPYPRARSIVLKNPDHIIALDCPCRSARENPCTPMDVCLVVGEPFASFVAESQPDHTRWITSEEAVEILQAERDRGHVHHAFFKDAMLDRFYAICNCCECCCGAMNAHRNGTPMLASSGYIARVDEDLCASCGDCETACQFGAIATEEGGAIIDWEACMGCGVCSAHCPQDAISIQRDENKGIPLEIHKLMEKAIAEAPDV
jgi:Pyruvate/2-oxoacid:ferredoxin oxidoreductase delta subunit